MKSTETKWSIFQFPVNTLFKKWLLYHFAQHYEFAVCCVISLLNFNEVRVVNRVYSYEYNFLWDICHVWDYFMLWQEIAAACTVVAFYVQYDVSHLTAVSSAEWSWNKPPSSYVRWQDSTLWDVVWTSPHGHRSEAIVPHLLWQVAQWP